MDGITQLIVQQMAGPVVRQLAQRLGVSESTAEHAVRLAVPLLIAALARNASQPQGAQELHQAVNRDHDGSVFANLPAVVDDPQAAKGPGILGHVLGGQRGSIESSLAQATGMDPAAAGSLLEMVAPLVMGAVGRDQRQNDLDPGGLADYLGAQRQQAQASSPDVIGMLSGMLDSNRDGSVVDDLGRIAGDFFKQGGGDRS
jgi:hypothetical protein